MTITQPMAMGGRGKARGSVKKTRKTKDKRKWSTNDTECQYEVGGVCKLHGPGAIEKYKPVMTDTVGPDGRKKLVMTKEWFYVCDLAPTGDAMKRGGKLKQTQLTFLKAPLDSDVTATDTQGEAGNTSSFSLTTTTVGQVEGSRRIPGSRIVDEN